MFAVIPLYFGTVEGKSCENASMIKAAQNNKITRYFFILGLVVLFRARHKPYSHCAEKKKHHGISGALLSFSFEKCKKEELP